MDTEKAYCMECRRLLNKKNILPSGLCRRCLEDLVRLFSFKPGVAISRIHEIQSGEGNNPCFNTGRKSSCGQEHCEWQDICNGVAVKDAV